MEWLKINEDGEIQFVIEEVKLVPEIQTMLTLAYNKGIKGDMDGRKKLKALSEMKYMYLVHSPRSPYRDYSEKERIEEAKKDCNLSEHWTTSAELKLLIEKYNKGNQNRITRSMKIVESFLDKFEDHLTDIKLDERNSQGSLVHNPGTIMKTLQQLPSFLSTLHELEQQARLGIAPTPTSKGDHELGWMAMSGSSNKKKQRIDEEETDDGPENLVS